MQNKTRRNCWHDETYLIHISYVNTTAAMNLTQHLFIILQPRCCVSRYLNTQRSEASVHCYHLKWGLFLPTQTVFCILNLWVRVFCFEVAVQRLFFSRVWDLLHLVLRLLSVCVFFFLPLVFLCGFSRNKVIKSSQIFAAALFNSPSGKEGWLVLCQQLFSSSFLCWYTTIKIQVKRAQWPCLQKTGLHTPSCWAFHLYRFF